VITGLVNGQSADNKVEDLIGVGQRLAEDGLIDLGFIGRSACGPGPCIPGACGG
jgi:hypothetical protein